MTPPERDITKLCGPLEFVGLDAEKEARQAFYATLESHQLYTLRKWLTKLVLVLYNPMGPEYTDEKIAQKIADGLMDRMKNPI